MPALTWWNRAAVLAVLLTLFTPALSPGEIVDRIVAVVNDEIITLSEMEALARSIEARAGGKPKGLQDPRLQREVLELLIDQKLAKEEAKRRGIKVADKEVDQALERFKQRNNIPNDETLGKALASAGMSVREFRQQLADQMTRERLLHLTVGPKVVVTDAEVRRIYEEQFRDRDRGGDQVHLLVVTMPYPPNATQAQREELRQKAEAMLKETRKTDPLGVIARKLDLTETDLGFVSLSDIEPRLAQVLANLKKGETAPVETPDGFQFFQVAGRRSGQPRTFEEAAPEIRAELFSREMERQFRDWIKSVRDRAHIKVMM